MGQCLNRLNGRRIRADFEGAGRFSGGQVTERRQLRNDLRLLVGLIGCSSGHIVGLVVVCY